MTNIRDKEKVAESNRKFRETHPNYRREYYLKNREKELAYNYNKTEEQKERKQETNQQWKNKAYSDNPAYKLRCVIRSAINRSLKNKKDGNICKYLDYSGKELREHMESLFEDWMNWDNMGINAKQKKQSWYLSNIIPISEFNIVDENSEDLKKYWALENLKPVDSCKREVK